MIFNWLFPKIKDSEKTHNEVYVYFDANQGTIELAPNKNTFFIFVPKNGKKKKEFCAGNSDRLIIHRDNKTMS